MTANKLILISAKTLLKIKRIEHIIYCATNCRIEFPFHKWYYKEANKRYTEYINNKFSK